MLRSRERARVSACAQKAALRWSVAYARCLATRAPKTLSQRIILDSHGLAKKRVACLNLRLSDGRARAQVVCLSNRGGLGALKPASADWREADFFNGDVALHLTIQKCVDAYLKTMLTCVVFGVGYFQNVEHLLIDSFYSILYCIVYKLENEGVRLKCVSKMRPQQ